MKTTKYLTVAGILAAALASSTASYAGDCKGVKFRIVNQVEVGTTSSQIKVTKIVASGNDGRWTENLANKKLNAGASYTTNKRRLNKLDSGEQGTFTVHFKRRQMGPGWVSQSQAFSGTGVCRDNRTYVFTLNGSY